MVVVATANHYWVDAIAAALLLMVAIIVVPQPYDPSLLSRWWASWRRRRSPTGPPALSGSGVPGSARGTGGLGSGEFTRVDQAGDYRPVRGSVTSGRELSSASSGSTVSAAGDCPPRPRPPSE